jgi:predicted HTH transcriptional regulator
MPPNKDLKLKQRILAVLSQKPDSSYDSLSMLLDKGRSTIIRHLKKLKDTGVISRQGARKKGTWIVHNDIIDTKKNNKEIE